MILEKPVRVVYLVHTADPDTTAERVFLVNAELRENAVFAAIRDQTDTKAQTDTKVHMDGRGKKAKLAMMANPD